MRRPKGILLDLDGTVYEEDGAFAGAVETVAALRRAGIPVRFGTNTTRMPRRELVERLGTFGIHADATELLTAPRAGASWLERRGMRRIALLLPPATFEDFAEFSIDAAHPQAVLVGDLGADWTFERMNEAFRWLLSGAELVAIQKNRYWKTASGLTLDAGPFVAALEYASGKTAVTVGKPSRAFFEAAAHSMGIDPEHLLVVGDDVETDVGGAVGVGARGCLVRTGKFRADDLMSSNVQPDYVIDSIAGLPAALEL